MHPDLFKDLSCVSGFNNFNGKTYNEHVVLVLGLTENLRRQILECKDYEEIINKLTENDHKITHQYQE
tara:strand:+ start:574 stop:777 length:204 start_codon:yes stop_codon:yes gene_type:complete